MQKFDAIVIGAGITGLTTAFYLKKAGKNVMVIDRALKAGGVICTHSENGFVYETGPNTGVIGCPEVAELFEDLGAACTLETANPKAERRLIWKGSKWHALPGAHALIDGITTPLFTLGDKIRFLGEPWRKKGNNPDETLADLVCRRLGRSFLDYAVDPFISGIYAGDPARLVTRYALPKLYQLEQSHGSFIKGAHAKHRMKPSERERKATRQVFSAEGGLQKLTDALANKIGNENLLLGANHTSVKPTENGYEVTALLNEKTVQITAPFVISTTSAHALSSLFPFLQANWLQTINQLEYAKIVQVAIGFEQWNGLNINAFGGLVPSIEKKGILGILFPSSFLENRAPKGGALLSVFLGGIKNPTITDKNDDELRHIVDQHLRLMLNTTLENASLVKIHRYQHAIPQYTISTKQRIETIAQIESNFPGLILAGNLRDGIGMADRIRQARMVAAMVLAG